MIDGTTRVDGVQDTGVLDMGYHYSHGLPVELPPRARFSWAPYRLLPDEPARFDASASYDSDGGAIITYEWDWDNDGIYDESLTVPIVVHSWDTLDSHRVTLRVWDNEGEYDTMSGVVPVFPNTIYVPLDIPTIQEAIGVSDDGDTIIVMPGIYYEHGINFLGKSIVVTSTDPLDSAVVASTIVDASAQGRVFTIGSEEDSMTVLTGFTIRNGYGLVGGIFIYRSSPTISWNVITENTATDAGGGIYVSGVISKATIINNKITNNTVIGDYNDGGGISVSHTHPNIMNNVISGNSIIGYRGSGGGIACRHSRAYISGNTIVGNSTNFGGGISVSDEASPVVVNSILWGNGEWTEIYIEDYWYPSTLTISYSNVEGGFSSVLVEENCTLNWGDGMVDTIPSFEDDGVHLKNDSPLRNLGDPSYVPGEGETDIDNERRVLEGRVDIGADEIQPFHIEDKYPPVINTRKEARTLE
jgi:predicted outer membrane repeat protein